MFLNVPTFSVTNRSIRGDIDKYLAYHIKRHNILKQNCVYSTYSPLRLTHLIERS
jgi:hypothetical protein